MTKAGAQSGVQAATAQRWQAHEVRRLLERVLVSVEELNALCIDHFPWVSQQVNSGMSRLEIENRLLRFCATDLGALVRILHDLYPERIASLQPPPRPSVPAISQAEPLPLADAVDPIRLRVWRGAANLALSCDRSEQWQAMLQIARRPGIELTLLPGPRGEAHDYFVERVRNRLPTQLRTSRPLRVLTISWPQGRCPVLLRDVVAALAHTLQCRPTLEALRAELCSQLQESILILCHPCIHPAYDASEDLLSYYLRALPQILADLPAQAGCKLLQPIEWSDSGWLLRSLAALFPSSPPWARQARSPAKARSLIRQLRTRQSHQLPVSSLSMLQPIRRRHVQEFLERIRFPGPLAQRQQLVRHLLHSYRRSDDILRWLAQRVPDESQFSDTQPDHASQQAPTVILGER